MRRLTPLWFLCILCSLHAESRLVVTDVASTNLLGARRVQVYLPPSYSTNSKSKYPVLYLHDGQNAFSSAGTNVAFGWGNWAADTAADRLAATGKIQEILLVAVDNSSRRYAEYCGTHHQGTNAPTPYDQYEAFLIHELKPLIDHTYRTQTGPGDTAVMGSSMGGICSVVLAWEHPEVFGKAASLSGAFQVEHTNFLQALRAYSGKAHPIRIYLDSGMIDFTGGDDGAAPSRQVAREFERINGRPAIKYYLDEKPMTEEQLIKSGLRQDKWKEAQTSQHNEFYWRMRLWRPLEFLFPAKPG